MVREKKDGARSSHKGLVLMETLKKRTHDTQQKKQRGGEKKQVG